MNSSLLVLLLLAPPSAVPEAWPQWRGPSRDGRASSFTAPATWPKQLKPLWSNKIGEGYSSPVANSTTACVHARQERDDVVACFDRNTGKQLWQDRYASPFAKSSYATRMSPAPFSTPVLASGSLYTLGANAVLSAYDVATGKLRWRKQPKQTPVTSGLFTGTAASPLLDDNRLIVFWGDDRGGELMALNPASGAVLWSNNSEHPVYSSPVAATLNGTRQYVMLGERDAFSVDARTGKTLWTIPYKDEWNENIVTPLVVDDLVIISGVRKPTTAWRIEAGNPKQVWSNEQVSFYMSSPVAEHGVLFGLSSKQKGQLVALDLKTGRRLQASEGRWADHAHLSLIAQNLVALTNSGALVVLDRNLKEIARYEVTQAETWAHPAFAGRDIFIKDLTTLHAFRLQ